MTNTSTFAAHPANKVGMRSSALIHFPNSIHPQLPPTMSSGVAQIHQWPHFSRCNVIWHKRRRMLPTGLPDIDGLLRSTLPLQIWVDEVSAHILHQIMLGYLPLLSGLTTISLFSLLWIRSRVNLHFSKKINNRKKRESFHLGRTCLLIPACWSFFSALCSLSRGEWSTLGLMITS